MSTATETRVPQITFNDEALILSQLSFIANGNDGSNRIPTPLVCTFMTSIASSSLLSSRTSIVVVASEMTAMKGGA